MHAVKAKQLRRLVKRRSFSGLMELYETNYRLLTRLVPDVVRLEAGGVSRVPGSPDLYLSLVEHCRFTTTLSLTYFFATAEGTPVADPNLPVRVYHDARQVEALSCPRNGVADRTKQWTRKPSQLDCKWEANVFLEKWLEYALAQGHRFPAGAGAPPVAAGTTAPVESC